MRKLKHNHERTRQRHVGVGRYSSKTIQAAINVVIKTVDVPYDMGAEPVFAVTVNEADVNRLWKVMSVLL
jgi:hypothetical protein